MKRQKTLEKHKKYYKRIKKKTAFVAEIFVFVFSHQFIKKLSKRWIAIV